MFDVVHIVHRRSMKDNGHRRHRSLNILLMTGIAARENQYMDFTHPHRFDHLPNAPVSGGCCSCWSLAIDLNLSGSSIGNRLIPSCLFPVEGTATTRLLISLHGSFDHRPSSCTLRGVEPHADSSDRSDSSVLCNFHRRVIHRIVVEVRRCVECWPLSAVRSLVTVH